MNREIKLTEDIYWVGKIAAAFGSYGWSGEAINRKLSKFEDLGIITSIGNKQLIVKNKLAFREYIE